MEGHKLVRRTRVAAIARFAVLSIAAVGLLLLAIQHGGPWLYRFAFTPVAKQLAVMGEDWREIRFTTETRYIGPVSSLVADMTGGGTLTASTQYVYTVVTGFDDAETNIQGGVVATLPGGMFTILRVPEAIRYVDYQRETGLYYLRIWNGQQLIDYKPPFERFPDGLSSFVVYRSENPETLRLVTPPIAECCEERFPMLEVLANEPTSLHWNMRQGCRGSLKRIYEPVSRRRNEVRLVEECPKNRTFEAPVYETSDREDARWEFIAFNRPLSASTMLLVPTEMQFETDSFPLVKGSRNEYLILAHQEQNVAWLTTQPQTGRTSLGMSLPDPTVPVTGSVIKPLSDPDMPVLEAKPNTLTLVVEGLAGRIATGASNTRTEPLSTVVTRFDNRPTIRIHNDLLVGADGAERSQQILSIAGLAASVMINDEEIVLARWQALPAEVKSGIIGGVVGLLGALATLWVGRRSAKRDRVQQLADSSQRADRDRAPVPPAETVNGQRMRDGRWIVFGGAGLAAAVGWLIGRRTSRNPRRD